MDDSIKYIFIVVLFMWLGNTANSALNNPISENTANALSSFANDVGVTKSDISETHKALSSYAAVAGVTKPEISETHKALSNYADAVEKKAIPERRRTPYNKNGNQISHAKMHTIRGFELKEKSRNAKSQDKETLKPLSAAVVEQKTTSSSLITRILPNAALTRSWTKPTWPIPRLMITYHDTKNANGVSPSKPKQTSSPSSEKSVKGSVLRTPSPNTSQSGSFSSVNVKPSGSSKPGKSGITSNGYSGTVTSTLKTALRNAQVVADKLSGPSIKSAVSSNGKGKATATDTLTPANRNASPNPPTKAESSGPSKTSNSIKSAVSPKGKGKEMATDTLPPPSPTVTQVRPTIPPQAGIAGPSNLRSTPKKEKTAKGYPEIVTDQLRYAQQNVAANPYVKSALDTATPYVNSAIDAANPYVRSAWRSVGSVLNKVGLPNTSKTSTTKKR